MEPLTAAAIASEVAAERALEAAALQTSEALASEAAREGLLAVEESLRTALRPAVERLAAGREQLARLPEGVGRYSAERHRLLPLENKLVGQSAEIYIERTYQGAGELTHPWEAPNGKRPDFMQTASESHRIDGVVDPSTGASDKVLVERGERVVHEVKTTQHPCATAEWARLSGQVEGTVQAMGEGQVDRMVVHVPADLQGAPELAGRLHDLAGDHQVHLVRDVPTQAIRASIERALETA